MCGFSGQLRLDGAPADRALVKRMTARLRHRGPDAGAHYFSRSIGLGHRRLAIIDSAGGGQPMLNDRRSLCVVSNSEIYNYLELRQDLGAAGRRFKTSSDTEVLLSALEHYGTKALDRLEGMFALALWNDVEETLVLARDPFGIKPLYYYADGGSLLFASELKSLLVYPRLDRELNLPAIDRYFGSLALPEPHSVFRRVHKLPAGHILTAGQGRVRLERYCAPPPVRGHGMGRAASGDTPQQRLGEALQHTVQLTLRSDVPVGVLLSGGVDSSTVAALAVTHSPRRVHTFSATFGETQYDESQASRLVARHLGTRHHEVMVTRDQAARIAARLTQTIDEPFADSSAVPTFAVCELASAHVKTVLSGEGADELFAGYPWHLPLRDGSRAARIGEHPSATIFRHSERAGLYSPRWRRDMPVKRPSRRLTPLASRQGSPLRRALLSDLAGYLPSDILFKSDRVSMTHSLEVRLPFLNRGFAEFVMALPDRLKIREGIQKYLLKRTAAKWLPRTVVTRPKQGFSIPIDLWLWQKGAWRDLVYDTVFSRRTRERDQFNLQLLERMQREHDHLEGLHGHRLWTVFIFEAWQRRFMDGAGA